MLVRMLLGLLLCGLLGCGSHTRAPVEDRSTHLQGASYTVKRGDTLYSIAFRYGMDFRKVATANGITSPYTIYPGQRIALYETPAPRTVGVPPAAVPVPPTYSPTPAVATPSPAAAPVIRRPSPIYTRTPTAPSGSAFIAGTPAVIPTQPIVSESGSAVTPEVAVVPPVVMPTQPAPRTPEPTPTPAPVVAPAKPQPKPPATAYSGGEVIVWRWPTSGSVTRGYSETVHKGIDIGGARGDPVVAVAAGKVVYAGTGIVGFGELLIIKHNDVYLSAYGHNDELLVSEGQTVTAGQTIARKGNSGTDTVKLHFEIRKEGKPIDPQRVLPRL